MVLNYDACNETLEKQREKDDKLTIIEERFNSMQGIRKWMSKVDSFFASICVT
jgi:hypothetical protein